MNKSHYLVVAVMALAAGFAGAKWAGLPAAGANMQAAKPESVYERVIRTKTLRCGYVVWEPGLTKDPNTGALGGFIYDVTMKLGEMLELKIDYAVELNIATYLEDLNTGKFDIECSGGFSNAQRGKLVLYSRPYAYAPTYAYTRADDRRFDGGLESINKKDVTVVVMDGDFSTHYRRQNFPETKTHELAASANFSDIMMSVVYGKADIAIFDAMSAKPIFDHNPGKLRALHYRLRAIPLNYSIPRDEIMLKSMIDTALDELVDSGYVDQLIKKYGFQDGIVLPTAQGYRDGAR